MDEFIYFKLLPIFESLTGFAINKNVKVDKIIEFIKSIKPFDTGIELIRVGPNYDGGYLIPNDLENIEALFSPGVGDVFEFEKELQAKGIKVFMADSSVEFNKHKYPDWNQDHRQPSPRP